LFKEFYDLFKNVVLNLTICIVTYVLTAIGGEKVTYNKRKLAFGGLGGVLIAVLIIAGFAWIGLLPTANATGRLVVKIKDAPAALEELWLTVDAVKVHRQGGGNETWYEVSLVESEPFDLLRLTDVSLVLAIDELLVGNYTEIRFHIVDANAIIDGVSTPLKITTEWVMVKAHFEIQEGQLTAVTIDINIQEDPILNAKILMPVVIADVAIDYNE